MFSSERYKRHLLKFKSLEGEFAKRIQGAGDRRALGILKSMHAVLMLERKGADINAEEMMRISELSAEAAELLPTSSAAQSLADLTRFTAEHLRDGKSFSINAPELEKNLLQVLSTDPANIHVKTSLEMLWRLRLSYGDNNWQTKKLNVLRDRFRADENVQRVINSLTAPSDLRIHSPD